MKTKNFNFEGMKMILQSTQTDLVEYFSEELKKIYGEDNCKFTDDYLFCKGKNKVLLVAHMDTVHDSKPDLILFDSDQGIIWSPQGIGGDDRGGIYSIIYVINKFQKDKKDLPCVLFTTNEEVGCVGASSAADELKEEIKDLFFAIELDRKGSKDMVFYGCENPDFESFIKEFGFEKASGSCSDISKICPKWGIAGVNLSHGVYNCHSKQELIYVDEMFDTINKVISILNSDKKKRFDYKSKIAVNNKLNLSNKSKSFYQKNYEDYISKVNSKIYDFDDNEVEEDDYGYMYGCYDDYMSHYNTDLPPLNEDDSMVEERYKKSPYWKKYKEHYGIKWAQELIDNPNFQSKA